MRKLFILMLLIIVSQNLLSQEGLDNRSKATFIFDIGRYVDFGDDLDTMALFKIGVLSKDPAIFKELGNLAYTRTEIQGKPVLVVVMRDESKIEYTNVLFVASNDDFNLGKVKKAIAGKKTLLITEGAKFGESMLNFVIADGQPRFELNEPALNEAGMTIPLTVLASAIKTREDWEALYDVTNEELVKQLDLVEEQKRIIAEQLAEIEKQKALLDSLDLEIKQKESVLLARQKELEQKSSEIAGQSREISRQRLLIAGQQKEVRAQRDTLDIQKADISVQIEQINIQLGTINQQEDRIKVQLESIEKQKIFLYAALFVFLLLSFLAYYIYRGYKIKKEANVKLEEKNRTITAQNVEIEKQRDLAETQRDQITYQKKHITDSIMYAKRIQTCLLPSLELFSDKIDHFVLYKPLDIVSGDFYWESCKENIQIIIAADCTGHGVPGAFMSMLGVTMLNEIVNGKGITQPDKILNLLRDEIIRSLKQSIDESSVKDGMDMTIIVIDYNKNKLWFSGANNPLIYIRDGHLEAVKGDKMPVAIHHRMNPFTSHEIDLKKGDCIYMFSDGYGDQFGGPRQKKFMVKNLKKTLLKFSELPMIKQGKKLDEVFEEWKGSNAQVDDVIIIGIRY